MAPLGEFGFPRGDCVQGAARSCNGASQLLDQHPWGTKTHTLAKAFLPTFIGEVFGDDGIAHPYDLVDQATVQALAMGTQAAFFGGFALAGGLISFALLPGQPVLAAFLGAALGIIVARIGRATLALHLALEPTDRLLIGEKAIRRLQRKMERQRRAANPGNYDAQGRPKKRGKHGLPWQQSKGYQATCKRKATKERRLRAHRKSLHGRLVHEIIRVGNTIITEHLSYKGWQKRFGKSVGLRAPGMLIEQLRRTVARTGGTLYAVSTRKTKLSQWCHGCGQTVKKPLSLRWHHCPCGVGPVQRDLYSPFLAAYLPVPDVLPSCARYQGYWEGAEARLRAAQERVQQRANAGQSLPQSMGS